MSFRAIAASAAVLLAASLTSAAAQQMPGYGMQQPGMGGYGMQQPGMMGQPMLDPQVAMMASQIGSTMVYMCQSGQQQACVMAQQFPMMMQGVAQAGQICAQMGDQQACGYYQQAVMEIQNLYNQLGNMMPQMPAPTYDPYNPLGPTHGDRMQAIQGWGSEMTRGFDQRMQDMDSNQQRFLDYINQ